MEIMCPIHAACSHTRGRHLIYFRIRRLARNSILRLSYCIPADALR
jgi:hypothetical protein